MPIYACDRCLKEFSQKSHYTKHLNKKIPCQDNKGKIEEVVKNIIMNKQSQIISKEDENTSINTPNVVEKDTVVDIDLQKFSKCDVFTPDDISQFMASKLNDKGKLLEPSVGCGNLLKYVNLNNYESVDVFEIKKEYLNRIPQNEKINMYNCDFIKKRVDTKYDNIIMNPPYIKTQDLSKEYRNYLKTNFEILNNGIVDIYYAFIMKCLDLLTTDGVLISITPNSYLYNKSSLRLRKYLFENQFVKEIIDFNDKKIFPGVSVYCCITIFTKTEKQFILYNNKKILYADIIKNYSLFNTTTSNHLKLKDICKIRNGIATLRDRIYIHSTQLYDEPCWQKITNGNTEQFIIYPYNEGVIVDEETFREANPNTYHYLLSQKVELSKRDKGKQNYPKWYAYGRTQSLKPSTKTCIYIPCFLHPNLIEEAMITKKNILHSGCLCIEPNDENNIQLIIQTIVNNKEFIQHNSSKRSGGWINLSSRTLYELELPLELPL